MTMALYTNIQLFIAGMLIIMGLYMTFAPLSNDIKLTVYRKSCRRMGIAITTLPVMTIIYFFTPLHCADVKYATALNLSGYYLISIFILLSFLYLLGHTFKNYRKVLITIISCYALFFFMVWGVSIFYNGDTVKTMQIIANIFLFINIIFEFLYFFKVYRKTTKNLEEFYSDDISMYIAWMKKTFYYMLILAVISLSAPLFFSYPLILGVIYIVYSLIFFIYVFISFHKFSIAYSNISKNIITNIPKNGQSLHGEASPELIATSTINNEAEKTILSDEISNELFKKIHIWIDTKRYNQKGITIQSVARDVGTNRTYLSAYINTTYKHSFKVWITQLRVDEAMELLCDNNNYSMTEIADMVGSSSITSFTHLFTRTVGISPAKWRAKNRYTYKAAKTNSAIEKGNTIEQE